MYASKQLLVGESFVDDVAQTLRAREEQQAARVDALIADSDLMQDENDNLRAELEVLRQILGDVPT